MVRLKIILVFVCFFHFSTNLNAQSLSDKLIEAAKNADYTQVKNLIQVGADVNGIDEYGKTALMYVCETAVKIENKSRIKIVNRRQTGPSMIPTKNRDYRNIYSKAKTVTREEKLNRVRKQNESLNTLHNEESNSSKRRGVFPVNPPSKKESQNSKSSFNVINSYSNDSTNKNVVENKTFDDYLSVANLLTSNNAKINATDKNGRTILHFLSENNPTDNYEFSQKMKTFKWAISKGTKINAKDNNGNTPLHLLVKSIMDDSNPKFSILLKNGADIEARDKLGRTPLMLLTDIKDPDGPGYRYNVVEALIRNKANVNTQDNRGWTPLMASSMNTDKSSCGGTYNRLDVVKLLIKNGADISIFNNQSINVIQMLKHEVEIDWHYSCRQEIYNCLLTEIDKNNTEKWAIIINLLDCAATHTTQKFASEIALDPLSAGIIAEIISSNIKKRSFPPIKTAEYTASTIVITELRSQGKYELANTLENLSLLHCLFQSFQ